MGLLQESYFLDELRKILNSFILDLAEIWIFAIQVYQ